MLFLLFETHHTHSHVFLCFTSMNTQHNNDTGAAWFKIRSVCIQSFASQTHLQFLPQAIQYVIGRTDLETNKNEKSNIGMGIIHMKWFASCFFFEKTNQRLQKIFVAKTLFLMGDLWTATPTTLKRAFIDSLGSTFHNFVAALVLIFSVRESFHYY